MTTPPRAVRKRGRRLGAALALVASASLLTSPASAQAQYERNWRYDQDVHLSYEFDDNVQEKLQDPTRAQVARISYRGEFHWAGGDQRLTFSYNGGFKRHFGVDGGLGGPTTQAAAEQEVAGDLDLSSQFVNEGNVSYLRRVSDDLAVTARLGIKDRTWTQDDFFFINEDAFRRYSASAGVVLNLDVIDPDQPARLEAGVRYADISFDNLDPHFGNWLYGGHVSLSKRFDEELEARWSYSWDRIRFPGRGVYTPQDTDPTNIIRGVGRERQEDHVHELGTELEWFGELGVVADYRFRFNDSNSFGFTYFSHNVGLQLLRDLPWGMFAQAYGRVELRSFTEPVPSFTGGSLDIGETENNVLMFRLVKDVSPDYSVEMRYARYRNESITLNDFYSKNIYSVGLTYHP
ncbi:MAG: hypothetical protein R3199_00440 [Gemmatimonadota bacterium]|nr:hypothetical protein [Gemmatimonadota bacterium]